MPAPVIGILALTLMISNTIFWCVPLYVVALFRWLTPNRFAKPSIDAMSWIAESWIAGNNRVLDLTQRLQVDVEGADGLSREEWYLVACNHQSYADIVILQRIFVDKIPMLKFFIKQELIWVPVLGLAWRVLDFPFMKRYSTKKLLRRPELKGRDLETTRAACEAFKRTPVSILNFLEGTRFTRQKKTQQNSPFQHLLKPKSGGAALVMQTMNDHLSSLIDVTIVYPDGVPGFWDFLSGKVSKVLCRVEKVAIPHELCGGDYDDDPAFKRTFRDWVHQLWEDKDRKINEMLQVGVPS